MTAVMFDHQDHLSPDEGPTAAKRIDDITAYINDQLVPTRIIPWLKERQSDELSSPLGASDNLVARYLREGLSRGDTIKKLNLRSDSLLVGSSVVTVQTTYSGRRRWVKVRLPEWIEHALYSCRAHAQTLGAPGLVRPAAYITAFNRRSPLKLNPHNPRTQLFRFQIITDDGATRRERAVGCWAQTGHAWVLWRDMTGIDITLLQPFGTLHVVNHAELEQTIRELLIPAAHLEWWDRIPQGSL